MLVWSSIIFSFFILVINCANNYYDAFTEMTDNLSTIQYTFILKNEEYDNTYPCVVEKDNVFDLCYTYYDDKDITCKCNSLVRLS